MQMVHAHRHLTVPTTLATLFPPSLSLVGCNHCLHPPVMEDGCDPAGCVPVLLHACGEWKPPVRPQTPTQGYLLPTPACSSLGCTFFPGVTAEGGCLTQFGQGAAITR